MPVPLPTPRHVPSGARFLPMPGLPEELPYGVGRERGEWNQMEQTRKQTDVIQTLCDMRDGAVIQEINEKFNELLAAVIDTAQKGELTVTVKLEPAKMGVGGIVLEVSAEHKTKIKKPELAIGAAQFWVTREGALSRTNPAQDEMFADEQESKKEKAK